MNIHNQLFDADLGMQKQIADLKTFLASALGEHPLDIPLLKNTLTTYYHNGRERGFYLGLMIGEEEGPLTCENLVFFEHRNCDDIILLRWQTPSKDINNEYDFPIDNFEPLTVKDIPEWVYPDKYTYTESWKWLDFKGVALYIRKIYTKDEE